MELDRDQQEQRGLPSICVSLESVLGVRETLTGYLQGWGTIKVVF